MNEYVVITTRQNSSCAGKEPAGREAEKNPEGHHRVVSMTSLAACIIATIWPPEPLRKFLLKIEGEFRESCARRPFAAHSTFLLSRFVVTSSGSSVQKEHRYNREFKTLPSFRPDGILATTARQHGIRANFRAHFARAG